MQINCKYNIKQYNIQQNIKKISHNSNKRKRGDKTKEQNRLNMIHLSKLRYIPESWNSWFDKMKNEIKQTIQKMNQIATKTSCKVKEKSKVVCHYW